MTAYKVKSVHASSSRDICNYLTHDERAIGYAYNHCLEKDMYERAVYQQLDEARSALGGTLAYGSQEVPTSYHLIISPLKDDCVSTEEILDYTITLLNLYVPDFSAFVVVHDDNENNIRHAHVVLNNVSVSRAGRNGGMRASCALPVSREHEFSRTRSRLAAERGWHAFTHEGVLVDAETWFMLDAHHEEMYALKQREAEHGLDEKDRARLEELFKAQPVVTDWRTRRIKKDVRDQYVEKRGTSWKADLMDRISLARMISADEPSFFEALDALSVDHRQSASKKHSDELVYTHPASNGKGIRGDHLGLYWSWWYMKKDLQFRSAAHDGWVLGLRGPILEAVRSMEREEGDPIQSLGHCAGKVVTASKLITALQVLDEHDVHCRQDGLAAWKECVTDAELAELRAAAILVRSLGILPEARGPQDTKRCRPYVNWEGGYGSYAKSDHVMHQYAPTYEYDRQFELGRTAPERDDGLCR